jgi:hypothetical protein
MRSLPVISSAIISNYLCFVKAELWVRLKVKVSPKAVRAVREPLGRSIIGELAPNKPVGALREAPAKHINPASAFGIPLRPHCEARNTVAIHAALWIASSFLSSQ